MDTAYTRSYLEALSFADLLNVANSCGIDAPDNLNRNFLIAEILEVASVYKKNENGDDMISAESDDLHKKKLPDVYNTTEIKIILQNPVWAFVFWNISDGDFQNFSKYDSYSLFLRVCSFANGESAVPYDSFEIKISVETKEQYVLLPYETEFVAVELFVRASRNETCLATSRIVRRPRSDILNLISKPGESFKLDAVMEISGADKLLRKHYISYRQLFS